MPLAIGCSEEDFETGCQAQHRSLVEADAERDHGSDAEATFGQRPGLVEDDDLERARPFEGCAIADQQAVAGGELGADSHHQGHGEAERMGAGNDHDGHHPLQREGQRRVQEQPDAECPATDPDRDPGEHGGGAIGEILRARPRGLGLFHEADHLREIGLAAGALDPHGQRAFPIDRAADDAGADGLVHRAGFAGEHTLVHGRAALGDDAIRRHLRARAHEHEVAGPQRGDRHLLLRAALAEPGRR